MASRRAFLKRAISLGATAGAAASLTSSKLGSQGRGRIAGFDHVAVPMRNTEPMLAFYRALGFAVKEGERICSVHMAHNKIGFHRPSLWQSDEFDLKAPRAEPPCGDFCFVWEGSMSSLQAMLATADAVVIEGPVQRQGGRDGGDAVGTSLYIRDPDQNLLEFIVYSEASLAQAVGR